MDNHPDRRKFIKWTALSGAGLGLAQLMPFSLTAAANKAPATGAFVPNRAASWWTILEDLQWPQQDILDKIKRRADGFAKADIDTAINFGFHDRFDFSNYFHVLHGYFASVCEELHQRNIRFIDHYSCNHVYRPHGEADFREMNRFERHSVLLVPDAEAAKFAQYEGHLFQDLCEVDLRDGSRGYASQYQFEAFCHNNEQFLDMHRKYLHRLMKDVPFDGIEVDDMCSYPGNTTCGCKYCRDRFRRDYGHQIPDFSDKSFFGDTSKANNYRWGNYDNPVYRDWLRMKSDSIRDHIKMVKEIVGDKPLMTCCSNTGPIVLNAAALNLEKMSPYLDLYMLENVGTNIENSAWINMDAEALMQKDIAAKRGNAPALALSYTLTEQGAYLGWALARFWGVGNWSSTLNMRLEKDPPHPIEQEDAVGPSNNWEKKYSDLNYREGLDVVEVRLVNNGFCRENGWRDAAGHEHWDRVTAWSIQLTKANTCYRFVRFRELADGAALLAENTPLILDGSACVSKEQFAAIRSFLSKDGIVWMALPFGTHDEKGFKRAQPLSDLLVRANYKNLHLIDSAVDAKPLERMISDQKFHPILNRTGGDPRWTARLRTYQGKPVIHFMNAGLVAEPDVIKDLSGIPLMKQLDSLVKDNLMTYELNTDKFSIGTLALMSPELGDQRRKITQTKGQHGRTRLQVDLSGITIYGVASV